MSLELENGWLSGCQQIPSPYFDVRPNPQDISLLVLHHISLPPGQFGGGHIENFFQGQLDPTQHPFFAQISALKVSAHFLIERDGNLIQFVSCLDRAWHAGVSSFAGRVRCNDYAIGIELEGSEFITYTDAQYQTLQQLTNLLMQTYPKITPDRVTGHQYIAPLRKTDPGLTFDWRRYRKLIIT